MVMAMSNVVRLAARHVRGSIRAGTVVGSRSSGGSAMMDWPAPWLVPFSTRSFAASTSRHATPSKSTRYTFPSHKDPSPYEIFHFDHRSVSSSEVKARYYDLVRHLHPDRYTPDSTKSKAQVEEEFKLVVQAYHLLKDRDKKHLYDRAGLGWLSNPTPDRNPWGGWQDRRYTRRYNPGFKGQGHDRFGWQHGGFYSNYHPPNASAAGWNGGNGRLRNGYFISTIFVVTWVLAGLQYGRLSLQSQKAIERADRHHLDAAKSLHEARQLARSDEGRQRWIAIRQRAREQKFLQESTLSDDPTHINTTHLEIGHGGPSGKSAHDHRLQSLPPPQS